MGNVVDILRGELERLFTARALDDLTEEYLGIDPGQFRGEEDTKAVFVRRLLDWCELNDAILALADIVLFLKKGMVDPRLRQLFRPSESEPPPDEETMAGYKAGEKLITMGIATFYRAEKEEEGDDSLQNAIGIVNHDRVQAPGAVQRLLTGLRIYSKTESEHLVDVMEIGTCSDKRPFLVIPWTGGRTLADLMPLNPGEMLHYMLQVLDGLEALHEAGLQHGDIKPENILVIEHDGEQTAVLFGYGAQRLSAGWKLESSDTGPITLFGTPKSMAPEQIRGLDTDFRTDIYSVGTTMFELLTGKAPFYGHNAMDTVGSHIFKDPDPLKVPAGREEAPSELQDLIMRAMSRDPTRRHTDVKQLRAGLMEVLETIQSLSEDTGTYDDISAAAELFLENVADEGLLEQLEEEAEEHHAWNPAAEVIANAAAAHEDEEVKTRLWFAAARIYHHKLKDRVIAEELYNSIIEADPDNVQAADALADIRRSSGRYEEVIEMLSAKAGKSEDREEKLSILSEIAEIYFSEAKDYSKAFDYYLLLLGERGPDEDLVARLEKLSEETGRWNELTQGIAAVLPAVTDPDQNFDLCLKLADFYSEHLNRQDYALSCYQQALSAKADSARALDGVVKVYRKSQQWTELAQVIVSFAQNEKAPSVKRDRLVEAATVYFEKLSDTEQTRKLLEQVQEEDPAHEGALVLLDRIYSQSEDWTRLADIYKARLGQIPESDEAALRYRLAELYEDRLDDSEGALENYSRVIELDPENIEALKGQERIYARKEDYARLLENLDRQLELAVTPRQKIQLLDRLAGLHEEEFRDDSKAIECYERTLELDPDHTGSLVSLSRLYRKEQRWNDLLDNLQARTDLADDDEEKIELMRTRAQIFDEKLGESSRAAEVFAEIARISGSDESTLEALARSQEESGDFEGLRDTLQQMIEKSESRTATSTLYVRLARIQEEGLDDLESAIQSLRKAVDAAPENSNALSALREAYVKKGDFASALEMHQKELKITDGELARAEVIAEMGVLCLMHLNDQERAVEYFEQALEIDPNCLPAADNVCSLYREIDRWEDALGIYERFYQSIDALSDELALDLLTHMGEACARLDKPDKALEIFAQARERAGDDPYLTISLGKSALAVNNAEEALKSFSEFLEKFSDGASTEDRVEALIGKAASLVEIGGREAEAFSAASQAQSLDPENVRALKLLAEIHLSRKSWQDAVNVKKKLADLVEDTEEKLNLLLEAGRIQSEQLKSNQPAIETLQKALELDDGNRAVLNQLMKVHSARGQWSQVVEVVLKLADLVEEKTQLAKYLLTVGKIYRRELKQADEALTYLDMALDEDPTLLNAFDNIVQINTDTQNWTGLERAYRKMISRLPEDYDIKTRINLWHSLAELYIHRLDRFDDAVTVLEAIRKLVPEERRWMEELSELYGWEAKYSQKAIALHHELLRQNPLRIESFNGLRRIYSEQNKPDESWCLSQVLNLLRAADNEEVQFYNEFRMKDLESPAKSLSDKEWNRHINHPDLDSLATSIFSLIQPMILSEKGQSHKNFELNKDNVVDLEKDDSEFTQLIKFCSGALGLETPDIFYEPNRAIGLAFAHTTPPSLVVGSKALNLGDRMGIAFTLAQYLAYSIPGFYVRQLLVSGSELSSWLLAAVKYFAPQLPAPKDQVSKVTDALSVLKKKMPGDVEEKLREHVQSFIAGGGEVNLKKWGSAVDLTADRAAFVLVHDLETAIRCLKDLPEASGMLSPRDRIKELTLFAISESYFSLRRHTGVALEPG